MMHWTAGRFDAAAEIEVGFALPRPASPSPTSASRRAEHVRMLEYAAVRRRRAASGEERAYWRACAPSAVARATRLRGDPGFACLP